MSHRNSKLNIKLCNKKTQNSNLTNTTSFLRNGNLANNNKSITKAGKLWKTKQEYREQWADTGGSYLHPFTQHRHLFSFC